MVADPSSVQIPEALIARITELAGVDLDVLTADQDPATVEALGQAHLAELDDALAVGRATQDQLAASLGGDPLRWVDAPGALDHAEAATAAARSTQTLARRSESAAQLGRLLAVLGPLAATRVAIGRRLRRDDF